MSTSSKFQLSTEQQIFRAERELREINDYIDRQLDTNGPISAKVRTRRKELRETLAALNTLGSGRLPDADEVLEWARGHGPENGFKPGAFPEAFTMHWYRSMLLRTHPPDDWRKHFNLMVSVALRDQTDPMHKILKRALTKD
jgi:hypothetical protein